MVQELKEKGNECFRLGNYEEAVKAYTQAINSSEQVNQSFLSQLYSNRALCYKKLGNYETCRTDSIEAIELDEKNIKAHLLCGQAYLELGKYKEDLQFIEVGIKRITRAYSLCGGQSRRVWEKELETYLYRGKKLLFLKNKELQEKLVEEVILTDYTPQAKEMGERLRSFIKKEIELPSFLLCPITSKVMRDPVVLPSGISCEREAASSLTRDPFTSASINPSNVVSNTTLKTTIEEFLNEHPWAFEYSPSQLYQQIPF
mmetsp:Transcript_13702/g.20040  ORF Transcript_13702/g.20040 Transcript_13702/m.20040 type:complete len:259 (-) Transcript_13702:33-809(-)